MIWNTAQHDKGQECLHTQGKRIKYQLVMTHEAEFFSYSISIIACMKIRLALFSRGVAELWLGFFGLDSFDYEVSLYVMVTKKGISFSAIPNFNFVITLEVRESFTCDVNPPETTFPESTCWPIPCIGKHEMISVQIIYPGRPPDSMWLASVTSFDQTSNCHLRSPRTPHKTRPVWIPTRILTFTPVTSRTSLKMDETC